MDIFSTILIAIGLSMDAFAASVVTGLSPSKNLLKLAFITAFLFGLFQGFMPIIGWFLGLSFKPIIEPFDHYIAFIILSFIGINMIIESPILTSCSSENINIKRLISLAFATSIDALATGVSFVVLNSGIFLASLLIALITFSISLLGVLLGKKLCAIHHLKQKIDILGGSILIFIGIKILISHLILGC